MSDWKSRATPVAEDWKSRATPVGDAAASRDEINAIDEGMRGEGDMDPAVAEAATNSARGQIPEDISPAATFFEHAGNTVGMGIVPPLTGAATATISKMQGDPRKWADIYRPAVQGARSDIERGARLNPQAATAGKATGLAASLALPAGAAARGAGAAARTGALVGAAYGGVGGLAGGEGLANLDPSQAAKDAALGVGTGLATGAALGPAGYALGKGISPVARYIGGKLQEAGKSASLKALGLIGSNFRSLNRQGQLDNVPEALQREGIIRPFSSTEANVARLQEARGSAAEGIEHAAKTVQSYLDSKLAEQAARLGSSDPLQVLQAGAEGIKTPFNTGDLAGGIKGARAILEQTPGVAQPALNKFAEAEQSILRGGPQDMTLSQGLALKRSLQEQAKLAGAYNGGVQSQGQDAIRSLASAARGHVLDVAGQVPGGAEHLEGALTRSAPLEAVGQMASDRTAMQQGNSVLGHIGGQVLGSTIGGLVGAGIGGESHRREGALLGMGAAFGQKALRERMPSLIATAAPHLARSLENVAQAGETPVARYIAGLLSGGTRHLSPELEGQTGEAVSGGNADSRHP